MNDIKHSGKLTCTFCENILATGSTRCAACGAERVRGHISHKERVTINVFRVILFFIVVIYFNYLYPTPTNQLVKYLNLVGFLALSLLIPLWFFKLKNRNSYIWKRKSQFL